VRWSICKTKGKRGLCSVPSRVQLGVFLVPGYAWFLQEHLVGSILLERPLWDCLPVGALVWVAIGQRMDRWTSQGKAVVS